MTKAAEALRAQAGTSLIDLTASNPTSLRLEYDARRICAALADEEVLTYEPRPFGPDRSREAVSAYYARRGVEIAPDRILLVATTSEAYAFLFRLLANPGDTIAVPRPSYPLFSFLADLSDVQLSPYHLRYSVDEGWRLDLDSLEEAVDPLTRAIITVTPNNPTGTCLACKERMLLERLARTHHWALISDEVFLDFMDDERSFAARTFAGTKGALTFAMSGISKIAGLPQMKLSWITVSGPDDLVTEAMARLEIIGDTFLSVSKPVVRALPEILETAEPWQAVLRARIRGNLNVLSELCATGPLKPRKREGGWYAILDAPEGKDDEAWALEILEREKVLIHPGYLFDVEEPSALVVSLIVPPEEFAEGVSRVLRCTNAADLR